LQESRFACVVFSIFVVLTGFLGSCQTYLLFGPPQWNVGFTDFCRGIGRMIPWWAWPTLAVIGALLFASRMLKFATSQRLQIEQRKQALDDSQARGVALKKEVEDLRQRVPPDPDPNAHVPLSQACQRLLDTYRETKHLFGQVVDALHDSEPNSPEDKWAVAADRFVKEDVPVYGVAHAGSKLMPIAKERFAHWTIKFDGNQVAHLINGGTTHYSHLSLVEKDLSEFLRKVEIEAKTEQYA